jgi:methyl-accepting chemotaxis protein
MFDEENERVGTVIEWADRTQEIAIEEEIQEIVEASLAGDLSQRIELDDKSGFFEKLSRGVNEMVDVSERIINDTVKVLGAMSHGDLTKTIDSNYQGSFGQLKNDANSTIAKLTEVMGEINNNANSVLNGAHEIAQGNANLSQRTEEQASSLEETASSMEEMTSTVRMNADNAKQADQLASSARELAEKGGEVVSNAVDAMSEITASSKKIADIIGVIDEIAFQTNLLALNAAVEAARAGEQGRGFAVVASEVRNLAGRSATAAKEIKGLIGDSVTKVEEGSKLVDESGKTLEGIMSSVKKVSDIIAEIAAAGEEQSDGIEQVNKAINQMDEMTQQNATLVEQAAAASEAMGEQARNLNELVGFFTTDGSSNNAYSTERRSGSRPWSGEQDKSETKPAAKSGANGLDFSAARIKHLSWKTRLRSFLDGQESMSKDQAVSHHDCDLGKWLYSTGMESYGHMPEMKTLEKVHAELHGIIKDVVRLKHGGDVKGAEKKFAKVESISGKIVAMLNHIESDVKSGAGSGPSTSEVTAPIQKTGTDDEWDEF